MGSAQRSPQHGFRVLMPTPLASSWFAQSSHFELKTNAMLLTAVLTEAPEGGYVALNPETGTTTQGESIREAISNLKAATESYLAEFPLEIHSHPLVTTFETADAWNPAAFRRRGRSCLEVVRFRCCAPEGKPYRDA